MINREAVISATNATMGGMSIFSSYNVCHSVCLGIIAALSFFGIIVAGFPLLFLTKYQIYFWTIGIAMLIIATALYFRMNKCISKHMILANFGLLFAGFPFAKDYFMFFIVTGFVITISAIALYFTERRKHG